MIGLAKLPTLSIFGDPCKEETKMALVKWMVLAFSLALTFSLWVPATAQSRCPNQERNSSKEVGMDEGGDSHTMTMELSRGRELPSECLNAGEEEEEEEFDSTVYLARFEFHRVETIFTVLVFIMVVVMAKMSEFHGWKGLCVLVFL